MEKLNWNISSARLIFPHRFTRPVPSAVYVILDDDTDPGNGYVKRVVIDITSPTTAVPYIIDTTNVAAGAYFLLAG